MRPFQDPPVVMGHRGAPGVAPENTPTSFAAAADAGATWVELDVRRTSDGDLVVRHDARLPDGRAVVECSAEELATLGVWRLEAVLDAMPAGLAVDVEIKNLPGEPDHDEGEAAAIQVADTIHRRAGERVWMTSSFSPLTVAALAKAMPEVPAGMVHWHSLPLETAREIALEYGAGVVCSEVGAEGLDAAGIEQAHGDGLAVMAWTVDDPDEAARLAAAGVDAICTNVPGALAERLADHGQRLRD